jgi:V/A-type H+-transporting ATPase subunit I
MDRVLIVGTKDVMETTVNALHQMDILHVEDYAEEESYFHLGKPMKSATSLSEKLLKLRSIRSYLGTKEQPLPKEKTERVVQDIEENLSVLETTLSGKMSEKSAVESELKELARKKDLLAPYEALGLPLDLTYGYENVAVYTGTMSSSPEALVKEITPDYEMFSAPYGKGVVVALFVPKADSARVNEMLMKHDFIAVEPLRESGMPADLEKTIDARQAELNKKLEAINVDIKALDEKYAQFILASEEMLAIDTQKAEAPIRFATSENTFIVDGWVPRSEYKRLSETLSKVTDDKVYVTTVEPEHGAYKSEVETKVEEHKEVDAPVAYNNPKPFRLWEAFTDLRARPHYDEIDPTMIFGIIFPLFYGFILGDMGYGLIILALCLYLRSVFKHNAGLLILVNVMLVCSITSIFFGALFGEFFGFNMAKEGFLGFSLASLYPHAVSIGPIGPFSLPFERLMPGGPGEFGSYVFGIKDLLVFTCLVGVAQILLGYVFGFRNEYVKHGLKTAILHKVSWMLLLIGGVAMVWYVFPMAMGNMIGQISITNPLFLSGIILFLIGLIMLLMGEGVVGLLELPNLMSNTLSYTRLLAVGLSSVGIAFAINTIAGLIAGSGAIGLIAAVIIFLLGHTINLVLGLYAPFIQSLRLHYVEFYMKFYDGGGKYYNPFGYIRKYTEE